MVAAPIITTAVITVLVASNFQSSVTIGDGLLGSTNSSITIYDDSKYGTIPSVSLEFDSIYQQIRYEVFDAALKTYLQTIQPSPLLATSINKKVTSKGTKTLCNAYMIPILIRRAYPTTYLTQQKIYKDAVVKQIGIAQAKAAGRSRAFIDEINNHISYHLLLMDSLWVNPRSILSSAYSQPSWGTVGSSAASKCGDALVAMKQWSHHWSLYLICFS